MACPVHAVSRLIREVVAPGGHVADAAGVGARVGVEVGAGVELADGTGEAGDGADGLAAAVGASDTNSEAAATAEAEAVTGGWAAGLLPPNGGNPSRPLNSVPMARMTRPMPTNVRMDTRPKRCSLVRGAVTVSLARTVPRA